MWVPKQKCEYGTRDAQVKKQNHCTCQGNGREIFCKVKELSGNYVMCQKRMKFCKKYPGNVTKFYISCSWKLDIWSWCSFRAKFIKFWAVILSGKFEFVSGNLISPECMNPELDLFPSSKGTLTFSYKSVGLNCNALNPTCNPKRQRVLGGGDGLTVLTQENKLFQDFSRVY